MTTKPTLNQSDLKLLKSVFATKKDLKHLATKDDLLNFASKDHLEKLKEEFKKFTHSEIEELHIFFAKYFQHIQLEELLNNHSERIKKMEQKAAFL